MDILAESQRLLSTIEANVEAYATTYGGKKYSELPREQQKALRGWWASGKEGPPPVQADQEEANADNEALVAKEKQRQETKAKEKAEKRAERKERWSKMQPEEILQEVLANVGSTISRVASRISEGVKSMAKALGPEGFKKMAGAMADLARSSWQKVTGAIQAKREEFAERVANGRNPLAAFASMAGQTAARGVVGAYNVAKSSIQDAKATMLQSGVNPAVATPLAILSGLTMAAPVSPGTIALTAMGQGWVNFVPGFTVAEGAMIPAVIAKISNLAQARKRRKQARKAA